MEEKDREDAVMTDSGESIIKIKLWGVIGVAVLVFGWVFVNAISLDRRVTTLETQYIAICEKLGEIKGDTRDIKKNVDDLKFNHYPSSVGR